MLSCLNCFSLFFFFAAVSREIQWYHPKHFKSLLCATISIFRFLSSQKSVICHFQANVKIWINVFVGVALTFALFITLLVWNPGVFGRLNLLVGILVWLFLISMLYAFVPMIGEEFLPRFRWFLRSGFSTIIFTFVLQSGKHTGKHSIPFTKDNVYWKRCGKIAVPIPRVKCLDTPKEV